MVRAEVPAYDELQHQVAVATGPPARRILELGTGTGTTLRAVLGRHPAASAVTLDESGTMLAASGLAALGVTLVEGRFEDPLPAGPFDVVVSALAVHHLDRHGKPALFRRIRDVLVPGGRVVLGDVVVPADPADAVTPLECGVDVPDRVDDQLRWLGEAGLTASVAWAQGDLAVLVGVRPG